MQSLAQRLKEWELVAPADLYGDPIWRLPAFRIARFLSEVAREDVTALIRDGAAYSKVCKLERSVPSIAANIAEGYSKFSGRERARYFEIALGSARESREWYREVGSWLGRDRAEERGMLLTRIIKILTVAIPLERDGACERRIRRARLESGSNDHTE